MKRVLAVVLLCLPLFSNAQNKNTNDLDRALFHAVGAGKTIEAASLIAQGANVNAKQPPWGLTPVLIAADVSREMLSLMLEKGGDVNAADRDGVTVLMRAVLSLDQENVKVVLNYLPRLEAKTLWNNTALMLATVQGLPDAVKDLVDSGADVNAVRADGMMPLDMAKQHMILANTIEEQVPTAAPATVVSARSSKINMSHDASKAELMRDTKKMIAILKRAGAQQGYGENVDEASLRHDKLGK